MVEGDDLLARLPELLAGGHAMRNMDSGAPLADVLERVTSANAYLGARPVAEALAGGAQIVLCGRVTDTALALGPLVHEFGWAADDWDRLAAGTIAGHILECGAQSTGGNFTRFWEVPELWNVGYPIAEVAADGTFVVTKHPGTGGMVTVDTVAEQLVYEMGDPGNYITPDVHRRLLDHPPRPAGPRPRAPSPGSRGRPRTPFLKVSASYLDGYKAVGAADASAGRARWRRRGSPPTWSGSGWRAPAWPSPRPTARRSCSASRPACRGSCRRRRAARSRAAPRGRATATAPRSNASARRSRRWSPPARRA